MCVERERERERVSEREKSEKIFVTTDTNMHFPTSITPYFIYPAGRRKQIENTKISALDIYKITSKTRFDLSCIGGCITAEKVSTSYFLV